MTLSPITSNETAASLRELPTLAVDLGFAQHRCSCGMAAQEKPSQSWKEECTFAESVRQTVEWMKSVKGADCVLILEAPLSASFDGKGNPCARGKFETHHSKSEVSSERRWNSGSGASMALAAIHFIRSIKNQTKDCQITLHLVEGFCSRYGKPNPTHADVACELLRLWKNEPLRKPEGHSNLSALHILDSRADTAPAAILRIPDGLHSSSPSTGH